MNTIYILEQLGCANCGAKIERDVAALDGVEEATLIFPTKQLRVRARDTAGLRDQIERIARSYESGITVRERDMATPVPKVFLLEQLGCANCGAKIERDVAGLDGVSQAVLVFATKQLRVISTKPEGLRESIERIAQTYEPDITVRERRTTGAAKSAKLGFHAHNEHAEEAEEHDYAEHYQNAGEDARSLMQETACGCGAHDHGHEEHQHEAARTDEPAAAAGFFARNKELLEIIAGAVLLAAGLALGSGGLFFPSVAVYFAAYLLLGWKIIWDALRNLTHGHVLDENFLMTVATLGALAIQEFPEAVGVMLFFRIGEYFEEAAVERSRKQIMQAVDLRPETVNRETAVGVQMIPAEAAQPGDVLIVRPGDRVPLDGAVLSGESFLDTSAITGEPVPVRVVPGDDIVSGCVNKDGMLRMRVERPLSESMVTRILNSVENAAASKPKIDRFITRFARVYTPFVVLLAVCVAVVPSLVTGNWHHWVYTALTFLVISCPCALVLSVPLAFFAGIGSGSRQGILFKGGISLEALAEVKTAVMDKTGTITQGTFTVTALEPAAAVTEEELLSAAASCEQTSTHPIAASILNSAATRGCVLTEPESVQETAGHGIRAALPDGVLLCGNAALMQQQSIDLPQLPPATGATAVLVARDGRFLGRILLSDTLKDGAAQTISQLDRLGIASAILTGDSAASAEAIAQQAGIAEVHAQLLPQEKLEQLQSIRTRRGAVLFVGDGINDAPVLAGADVGAAMGSGADAAIEAADVVYLTSELRAIPESIGIARTACRIARENVVFALAVKALIMVLGLLGIASMWLAVFADSGVAMLCVLNSIRILYQK